MWRGPVWVTVLRDLVFLTVGAAGVIWQGFVVPRPQAGLIAIFAVVMAGPGILAGWWLAQSATGGPLPPPQPPQSSSPSASSSPSNGQG